MRIFSVFRKIRQHVLRPRGHNFHVSNLIDINNNKSLFDCVLSEIGTGAAFIFVWNFISAAPVTQAFISFHNCNQLLRWPFCNKELDTHPVLL